MATVVLSAKLAESVLGKPILDTAALFGGQETCSVRLQIVSRKTTGATRADTDPVVDKPPADSANEHRSQAFDDEDPCPAALATQTTHLRDGGGQQTTEGAGKGGICEEDCQAEA